MINLNGMAHVILTVSQFDRAKAFYSRIMPAMGMDNVFDGDDLCYFVGARTAVGIQPCDPQYASERFVQGRVGLHHLCLRARSREDVDKVDALLHEMGGEYCRRRERRNMGAGLLLCVIRRSRRYTFGS